MCIIKLEIGLLWFFTRWRIDGSISTIRHQAKQKNEFKHFNFSHILHFTLYLFWLSLKITGSLVVTCGYFEVPPESFIKELMNNQRLISSTQWKLGWWERFRLRPYSDEVGHHLLVTWWHNAGILCCLVYIHSAVMWSAQLFPTSFRPKHEVKVTYINTRAHPFLLKSGILDNS